MDINKTIESLSPNERKILPHIIEKNVQEICKKSNLDKTSVIRSLEYLDSKGIIDLEYEERKIIDLGVNGALYKKKGLPERRLLNLLGERRIITLGNAQKESKLSPDEFKASLGVLKKKSMIDLKNGKIILNADKVEVSKKFPEEIFLDSLPLKQTSLKEMMKKYLRN